MSDFVLDLVIESKRLEGEWITCDDPEVNWYGCRFLVKPATTQLAERVQRIQKLSKGGRDIGRFTAALLGDLMLDVDGIGFGDRAATLDEAIEYFAQIPAFVAWLMEQSMDLAVRRRGDVEAELGN